MAENVNNMLKIVVANVMPSQDSGYKIRTGD